jgi:hypothetical protein
MVVARNYEALMAKGTKGRGALSNFSRGKARLLKRG